MTCPTCNGPLKMLFTSSYCEACERSAAEKAKQRAFRRFLLTQETWTLGVTETRPVEAVTDWVKRYRNGKVRIA